MTTPEEQATILRLRKSKQNHELQVRLSMLLDLMTMAGFSDHQMIETYAIVKGETDPETIDEQCDHLSSLLKQAIHSNVFPAPLGQA